MWTANGEGPRDVARRFAIFPKLDTENMPNNFASDGRGCFPSHDKPNGGTTCGVVGPAKKGKPGDEVKCPECGKRIRLE
mgnify:CR=1 FL=1